MNSFFDVFKWDRFVAPSAMELLFWLLATIAVLFGLWGLVSGFAMVDGSPLQGLVLIAVSIVGTLAAIIAARVSCEAIVILFRVNENLMDIAERGIAIAQPVVESEAVRLERRMAEARERAVNRASEPASTADRPTIDHRLIEAKPAEPERAERDPFGPDRGRVEPKAWDVKPPESREVEPRIVEPRMAEAKTVEPVITPVRVAAEPKQRDDKVQPVAPAEPRLSEQRKAEPRTSEPRLAQQKVMEPRATEAGSIEPRTVAPKSVDPITVGPRTAEPRTAEPKAAEPKSTESKPIEQRPERRQPIPAPAQSRAAEPKVPSRPLPRRAPLQVEPAIEHALRRLSEPSGTEAMQADLSAAAEEARRTEALHEADLVAFEQDEAERRLPPSEDDDVTPLPAFIGRHSGPSAPEPATLPSEIVPPAHRARRRNAAQVTDAIESFESPPRTPSRHDARSDSVSGTASPLRGPARRPDQHEQRPEPARPLENTLRQGETFSEDKRQRGNGMARNEQARSAQSNAGGPSGQSTASPKSGPAPASKGAAGGKGGQQAAKGGQAPLKRRRPRPSRDGS